MSIFVPIIVNFFVHFLAMLFVLRFYMRFCSVGTQAPMAFFVARITNPVSRIFNVFFPQIRRFDYPALLIAFLILLLHLFLIMFLGGVVDIALILKVSIFKLFNIMLELIFFAVLARVILSWVEPGQSSDISLQLFNPLTDWVLDPVRRVLPTIGMIDLSPLAVLLSVQLIQNVIVNPIANLF